MTKRTMLLAVSGGVDSVVLLDMLARSEDRLVVAHVDHGIREESPEDARFVEGLARQYQLPFVSTQLELGLEASEDMARRARYAFLEAEATKFGAAIVTAHHLDDMVGSVAINLIRGTGWRGLAVMNRPHILRPLLGFDKAQLYEYALRHRLEWVEDATNHSPVYLRNRLRAGVTKLPPSVKYELSRLRAAQQVLVRDIDRTAARLVGRHGGSRYFYTSIDDATAIELLRTKVAQAVGDRPTILQAERALLAIKTGRVGRSYDVGDGVQIALVGRDFYCRLSPQMVE